MNNLKRELAPVSTAAWKQIDAEATRVLKLKLAGRKLVDFDGPLGPAAAAVNTGRREPLDTGPVPDVEATAARCCPSSSCAHTSSCRARRWTPWSAVRRTRSFSL